ncbi:oxygen sensor histidine kinase NreB [Abditibacteriota bacterium]|nr:oxygen sensor histidine kinase NreB [Abditibacteriota bacterium]
MVLYWRCCCYFGRVGENQIGRLAPLKGETLARNENEGKLPSFSFFRMGTTYDAQLGAQSKLTPRMDAGAELEPDERYRALASVLVVWSTTLEGEFFERETGWREFTGQSSEAARGFGWLAQVHPDDLVQLYSVWRHAAKTEQAFETEYRLKRFDGEYRRVLVRAVPIYQDGKFAEWAGTLADVEDARRAQERLREGEERLRFALAVSGTGVWDWNITTGQLEWNDGHHHVFGRHAETPRVMSDFVAYIHEDDAARITSRIHEALQTDDVADLEYRIVQNDGKVVWARIMGRVYARDENGVAIRKMGVISDITAQKEAEEVLRRSQLELQSEAQSARAETAELRRRLLARLVEAQEEERRRLSRELHDQMGQNLTVVAMNLRALSEFVNDSTQALRRTDATLAHELDHRFQALQVAIGSLGEQMGTLARELRPPSLDTLGLTAALRQLVGEWERATGICAQFDVLGFEGKSSRFKPEIEVALYRVVQEALTNVARHANAKKVSVLLQRPGNELTAIVEDDGNGFEPERAAENRLGMVGMRERLDAVGGTLQIESEPNAGTTIFVRVPLK